MKPKIGTSHPPITEDLHHRVRVIDRKRAIELERLDGEVIARQTLEQEQIDHDFMEWLAEADRAPKIRGLYGGRLIEYF